MNFANLWPANYAAILKQISILNESSVLPKKKMGQKELKSQKFDKHLHFTAFGIRQMYIHMYGWPTFFPSSWNGNDLCIFSEAPERIHWHLQPHTCYKWGPQSMLNKNTEVARMGRVKFIFLYRQLSGPFSEIMLCKLTSWFGWRQGKGLLRFRH